MPPNEATPAIVLAADPPDASVAVLTTGQSGNPASPHWNDHAEVWASGGVRPAPFTRPAVEAVAERSLQLVPG